MATPLEILLQVVGQSDVKRALEEIGSSMKGVNTETKSASGEMNGFGQSIVSGLGVGTGFALITEAISMVKSTIIATARESVVLAAEIKNTGTALGVGSEAYQVLRNLIEDTGGSVGNLTQAITTQIRTMEQARAGTATAANAYRALGLDLNALSQMPIQYRMEAIGRAINGAADKNQAFGAAADILGSRNVRFLLAALNELGSEGFDKLAASAAESGRVMSEDTAVRLADAKRSWQEFHDWAVVKSGAMLGYFSKLFEGYRKDFWGTLSGALPPDRTMPTPPPNVVDVTPLKQTVEWKQADLDLTIALASQRVIEADQNLTEKARHDALLPLLWQEYEVRERLVRLSETHPLSRDELQNERALLTTRLEADRLSLLAKTRNENVRHDSSRSFDEEMMRYRQMNDPERNKQYMSPLEGIQSGLAGFVLSAGTVGQQVARTLRDTIGGAVQSISSGISGLIMGTKTWAAAFRDVASTILTTVINAIVQMGAQWLAQRLMMLLFGASAKATETATTVAAAAASTAAWAMPAMLASIASFGAADVAGMAGYSAAVAEAAMTSAIGMGFDSGGYTGDGSPADVAGFVHGSEFVFSAPATARIGRSTLESMHSAALGGNGGAIAAQGGFSGGGNVILAMSQEDVARAQRKYVDARVVYMSGLLPRARTAL